MIPHLSQVVNRLGNNVDRLSSLIVLVIILTVAPIGYHMIALNVPSDIVQRAIADQLQLPRARMGLIWSFLISCQSIGAFVGCFLVVPLERKFGTKRSLLLLNNVLLVVASLLFMAISPRTGVLLPLTLGRLLVGLYTGIGCSMIPVYVQQLAPIHLRGALCCFVHIAICAGSALAAFLSLQNILGGPATWTTLLSLPILPALAQVFLSHFLCETPNYFLCRNERELAAQSIRFHYSLDNGLDSASTIREYQSLVTRLPPQLSVKQAFADPKIRSPMLLGMAISMAQIFSGSMAAVSYSTSMLESVSFTVWLTPFIPTLGSILSILLTLPALRLVESCGRKQLLVNTLGICAFVNYLLVLFSLLAQILAPRGIQWPSIGFALCFFVYGIGYNVGVGPVAYFMPAELVPPNAVSAAMGTATAANWLSSMLTTMAYYPLNELIGGWSFLLFALPTTLAAIIFHKSVPDEVGSGAAGELSRRRKEGANGGELLAPTAVEGEEATGARTAFSTFSGGGEDDGEEIEEGQQWPSRPDSSAVEIERAAEGKRKSSEHTPLQTMHSWTSGETTNSSTFYSTFSTIPPFDGGKQQK